MGRPVLPLALIRMLGLLGLLGLLASGCASKQAPNGPPDAAGRQERGQASWYGHPYHGRTTASGEVYDMNDLTAAHQSLPFGTRVEVTNLSNGRSVVVRINDRGPFKKGRIIDLSRAAARKIDMIEAGVVAVRLVVL